MIGKAVSLQRTKPRLTQNTKVQDFLMVNKIQKCELLFHGS